MTELVLKQQAIASVRAHDRKVASKTETIQAALGDGDGNIAIAARPGWVYVRIEGASDGVAEALCRRVDIPLVEDTTVDLRRVNASGLGYYEVIGLSATYLFDTWPTGPGSSANSDGSAAMIGEHAAQHERYDGGRGGYDPVNVHARMFVPLRARASSPASLRLWVDEGFNPLTGNYYAGGYSPLFSPPAAGPFEGLYRIDLLYLGDDDALHITTGTAAEYAALTYPALPAKGVPLAFVILTSGQASITEAYIVRDARIVCGAVTAAPVGEADAATSVVSETSYGQASAVGTSVKYARQDHTHGTPGTAFPVTIQTGATYTIGASDCIVIGNRGTAQAFALPAATGSGKVYYIKQIGAGAVTVDADGSETIDGSLTQTLSQWDTLQIVDYAAGTWGIL